MKITKNLCLHIVLIFGFVFFLSPITFFALSEVNGNYLRALKKNGLTESAALEYRRKIFYETDDAEKCALWYSLSLMQAENGDYEEAEKSLYQIRQLGDDPAYKGIADLRLAEIQALKGNTDQAERQFSNIIRSRYYPEMIRKESALLMILVYMQDGQWQTAGRLLESFEEESRIAEQLSAELSETAETVYPDPEFARRLSLIMPGSGQIYSGHYSEGIHSFILNAGLAGVTALMILQNNTGGLLLLYGIAGLRYYFGGIYHAGRLAEEREQELIRQQMREIYPFWKEFYEEFSEIGGFEKSLQR